MIAHEIKYCEKTTPATPAAAGGILSSWFLGSVVKPRLVVMVGRYHCRA